MIRKKASSGSRSRTSSSQSRGSRGSKLGASRRPAKGDGVGRGAAKTSGARRRADNTAAAERGTAEPEAPASAPELTAKRRRELRGDAHALEPIVHVGHGGVSESVVRAVSRALRDHELIKVRLHEPEDKQGMAAELAEATRSALCGLVGHTVILFRPKPKQPGVSGIARTAIKRNRERRGRP